MDSKNPLSLLFALDLAQRTLGGLLHGVAVYRVVAVVGRVDSRLELGAAWWGGGAVDPSGVVGERLRGLRVANCTLAAQRTRRHQPRRCGVDPTRWSLAATSRLR